MPDLRPLLSPDSVAIIGAAADDSLRGRLTHQLIEHGFDGHIYPVTRSQKEVLGHKAYASVADIPEAADLAVILVPAAHVVATIEQCAARGIPAAVVISSGFAEEKSEEAAARDLALRAIAERTGMVIAGPNSEGLVNPLRPLVATFSPVFHDPKQPLLPERSKAKPIAVSCQSGALTFAFLSRGRDRQLRFTYQVSAGNQTVLEAHDYVSSPRSAAPMPAAAPPPRIPGRWPAPAWPTTRSSAITASSAAKTSTTWSMSRPPSRIARCPAATGSR